MHVHLIGCFVNFFIQLLRRLKKDGLLMASVVMHSKQTSASGNARKETEDSTLIWFNSLHKSSRERHVRPPDGVNNSSIKEKDNIQ